MALRDTTPECPKCADWIQHAERLERKISLQSAEYRDLSKKFDEVMKKFKELQEQVASGKKDSTNSSKPPSSDIVKPPNKSPPGQRRRGGQLGHAPQQRPPFELREIDDVQRHAHESCPRCGGPVEQLQAPAQVLQQVELVVKPTLVTEHHSCTCHCRACNQNFTRPIPPPVAAAGTFGSRLTAWIAYLKGATHASYTTIQQVLLETCGLEIATGTLTKLCQKVSRSLQISYDELLRQIPQQENLHIDETSHRENGKMQWTWVFRAPQFTLFQIAPTRGAEILDRVLGDQFTGTVTSDYYGAYRHYLKTHPLANAQFCLAHLVRDVRFLETLPDEADRQFAAELLPELKELFRLWHARGEAADQTAFLAALIAQGEQLARVAIEQAPDTRASRKLARRFHKHGKQYLRFTRMPGLEPTNNAAEQAIRYMVIDRHVTQGTRSPRGRDWCQRIWTTIATCRQHGKNLLTFLQQSVVAFLTDLPPPTLSAAT
jgi:transposase